MDYINHIFDLLDSWRHLPDYQLERRADIFFAAYLPKFLSSHLGLDIRPRLIPEFPVRLGTICPETSSNQSVKIDYVALTANASQAIFLELKTDALSRRDKQDKYLQAAKEVRFPKLLDGILQIARASDQKHKYCCLLQLLGQHSLLTLPASLDAALASAQFATSVNACLREVQILPLDPEIRVMYLQPTASESDEIGFDAFAEWLDLQNEDLAKRFAKSLRQWAAVRAGYDTCQP